MAKRLTTPLVCLVAALATACASSGNPYEEDIPQEVELIVSNQRQSVVTAFYQWEQASPVRLGEIRGGDSIFERVSVRGQALRVFFVSPGRSPGDPGVPEYATARAGDRFEWLLRADGSIFYQRLSGR